MHSGSKVWVSGWNPTVWSSKWKLLMSSIFLWCCLLCLNVAWCSHFFVFGLKSQCDHSNYFPAALFIVLNNLVLTRVCRWNPTVWPIKWKQSSSTIMWCCLLCCTSCFQLLSPWMKSQKYDHSNKSYWALLSCGAIYHSARGAVIPFKSVDEILKCDH